MPTAGKDTIYIDVDDEITAIIEKVKDSSSKIVALVLPKRAAALQSIVNMKLLHRAAKDADKNVVLITTEAGLLPLAGAVGMYVAKSLQSKPEIPAGPQTGPDVDEDVAELDDASDEPLSTTNKDDTVELDDEEPLPEPAAKPKKKKSGKSPKIPNFEKFRSKLFIGGAVLVLLIGLFYMMGFVWPSATITITTDTEDLSTNTNFVASTVATAVSVDDKVVPATKVEAKKEDSEKAPATGEKDVGDKATGSVSLRAQQCGTLEPPAAVNAGSTVTAKGQSFITESAVGFAFENIEGGCINYSGTATNITAKASGTQYNVGSANFVVAGRSNVSGPGSASGGTSKIVKVVSQQDVDNAKGKLDTGEDAITAELVTKLTEQGLTPIKESLQKTNEKTDVNPGVGAEASEVTVSYSVTYTMLGVKADDLTQVVAASVQSDIDPERQQVQDAGLDQASYKVKSEKDGKADITISTIVAIGPKIDTDKLKAEIAGKKKGETEEIVRQIRGVNEVSIDYSPFWVNKTPTKANKVTIEFQELEQ